MVLDILIQSDVVHCLLLEKKKKKGIERCKMHGMCD